MSKQDEVVEPVKQELLHPGFSPDLCSFVLRAMNTVQMSGEQNMAAGLMVISELKRVLKEWQDKQPKEETKEDKKA